MIITENQVKSLMKILESEESIPSFQGVVIPSQLNKLGSLMDKNGMDVLTKKFGPEVVSKLKQLFGIDKLTDTPVSKIKNFIDSKISSNLTLSNPLGDPNFKVGSGFNALRGGKPHQGVDIPANSGTPVYAPENGTVIAAKDTTPNRCGGFIQLDHGKVITKYCHLSKWSVAQGETVKKGQVIGYTGGGLNDPYRGDSSGAHLHYEIKDKSGLALNPQQSQFGLV